MSHHPLATPRTPRLAAACALLASAMVCAAGEPPTPEQPAPPPITAPAPPDADADTPTPVEPRIIRGNDQVIGAAKAPLPSEGAPSSFRFEEAPIAEVVRTLLGDMLKADYVLHPPITGSVTLATRAPVSPDQALYLLESALQANGLALLRDPRGAYHVGRPEALKGLGAAVRQAPAGGGALPPGSGAVVVPLQFIGAGEMAAILRPMMPADAMLRVDTLRNLLVFAGNRHQAEAWLDIVNTFDVDLLQGMSVGVFPLKYTSIKEVEAALQWLSSGGAAAGQGAAAAGRLPSAAAVAAGAAPAPGAASGGAIALSENLPLAGAVRVLPIERINSILVVTPRAAYLDQARRWIERLDQPSDNSAEPRLFIYQVQNVNARHLSTVLSGIFGAPAPAGGSGSTTNGNNNASSGVAPMLPIASDGFLLGGGLNSSGSQRSGAFPFGGGLGARSTQQSSAQQSQPPAVTSLGHVRIMADELNNAVLVWGTRAEYAKIESTLKRLDLPPTQVLIEASIIEVTLNDELRYGLQWAFNDSYGSGATGRGAFSSSDGGVLGGAKAGFSYALKSPAGAVRAMLNALSGKTTVKVVASPSLMVLDNHTAAIAVGDQTPVQAGTTSTLQGTYSNIQYKDTGVNLVVTPSVNAGNIVTMQVEQSVTDVGNKDEVTNQRAFLQRQLSSKVAVRSGESIVMGGLIQENSRAAKSGIPLLHDLPVLGNLFGSTVNDGRRTELLIVITPRVVRSDIDIRQVSEDLRDRMKSFVKLPPPANAPDTPAAPPRP